MEVPIMMTGEWLGSLKNYIWLIVILWVAMCLARKQFEYAIMSLSRIIHNGMRLTAASISKAEKNLMERNREILIADGLDYAERSMERKFTRLGEAVERDMQRYPAIHRKMAEAINKLEDDYNKTTDVPPSLPDWITIIDKIASIKPTGDNMVANMLKEIKDSLNEQHKTSLEKYRNSIKQRHSILSKMLPLWRGLQKSLDHFELAVSNLSFRAKGIDRFVESYEQIRDKTDKAMRNLSSSSLTQFFVAGLVMAIAIGGIIINFHLIALPMSEMVGGSSYIGNFKMSQVAGLVIILIELLMGLFLMESLRITRLFPIIGNMDDNKRKWMIGVSLTLLTVFAGIESSLAFMRDRIAADNAALTQSLAGVKLTDQAVSKIPLVGQMVMGFIFPFALAFVAIPLESFIKAFRSVLGVIGVGVLRLAAFLIRLVGNIVHYLGICIVRLYDVIVFPRVILDGFLKEKPFKKLQDSSQGPEASSADNEKDTEIKKEEEELTKAKGVTKK